MVRRCQQPATHNDGPAAMMGEQEEVPMLRERWYKEANMTATEHIEQLPSYACGV